MLKSHTSQLLLWCLAAGAVIVYILPRLWAAMRAKPLESGDSRQGVILFVEPLRWLGVRWGRCEAAAGLRRAGFAGEFVFWEWDPTWRAMLVLPTIAAPRFLDRQAQRLADRIKELRQANPDRPIHLMGYSCGGFVAVRALELTADEIQVDSLVLLAAAFSPGRDLNPAAGHVRGPVIVGSSMLDIVVGLGTLMVGTADRKFTPSIGTLGYRGPACRKITSLRWRPSWIRWGHWGSHFTAPAERFVSECIAPALGLRTQEDSSSTS
jgi:pimeloyl-ACP methyl ester carboxylesterase